MNLYSRLAHLARYQPDKIALETARAELTYAGFDLLVCQAATALRSAGVGIGDVVGVRLRETPEYMATMFAAMRVGAILLPLDWRGTRGEFDRVAGRFQPKVFVNDDKPPVDWHPRVLNTATFLDHEPDEMPLAELADAPFVYGLTSGTTGEPKATVVTHETILARYANRAMEGLFASDDRFLNTLSLAYTAGREHALCALLVGGTLLLFPPLFQPAELVDYVGEKRIDGLNLSPNMSRAILSKLRSEKPLMPGLRVLISTTGKLQPEERTEIRSRVSPNLRDYYGSTGVGMIALIAGEEDGREPTAAGRPITGVEIGIADPDGLALPDGEVGRIRIRGPAVAAPFSDAPDVGEEGFHDGWYYPGDLGSIGPNGLLHLHGRAADLIKRGGLMVHAQEVELALRRHPHVVDAAVVGAPSPDLGQEVVAFVVANAPVDERDLARHCRGELAPFKVPARFLVVDDLPRNPNGKVVKAQLLGRL